jgi:hypothetical protein
MLQKRKGRNGLAKRPAVLDSKSATPDVFSRGLLKK